MSYDFITTEDGKIYRCNLEAGRFYDVGASKEFKAFIFSHNPRAGTFCFPLKKGDSCFKSLEEWRDEWVSMGSHTFKIKDISGIKFSELLEIFPPEYIFTDY
jgi:hypothetical protein